MTMFNTPPYQHSPAQPPPPGLFPVREAFKIGIANKQQNECISANLTGLKHGLANDIFALS